MASKTKDLELELDYRKRIAEMTDAKFRLFYWSLVRRAGLSRHSECELQARALLSIPMDELIELLQKVDEQLIK